MIEVTRLNGMPMLVNSDLIKIAESSPDTMLTLIHGEKLIIRESCEELLEKILAYRATLLAGVADRLGAQGELHRVVALASLNAESGATLVGGVTSFASGSGSNNGLGVVAGRSGSTSAASNSSNGAGLKLEPTGR